MPEDINLPLPFDISSFESIKSYFYAMQYARLQAEDNPLEPQHVLSLKLHCKAKPSQASRPLPWFASKEGTYSCKLLRPLQTGPDKYSQVWTASVLPTDGAAPGEGSKIVLKIFQPSLSMLPKFVENNFQLNSYLNPEQLAKTEDLAYSEFVNIQGIFVPYYYGMQKTETPSGESAWVIAMEYIEGATVARFVRRVKLEDKLSPDKSLESTNTELFCKMYCSMAKTMRAIIKNEVQIADARVQNFIFNPKTEAIVAIDFAQVYFGFYHEGHGQAQFGRIAREFLDCFGSYFDSVHDWVCKNMPEGERGYNIMTDEERTRQAHLVHL